MEVIRLNKAIKVYDNGRRGLGGVDISIAQGQCAAVLGAPGSGKNTLMRLIAGMDMPSAGEVYVLDTPVHAMSRDAAAHFRSDNMGIVPRRSGLMPRLSILQNVQMPLAAAGMPSQKRTKMAKEPLDMLGIAHVMHAYPAQLSAYEVKTAALARALVMQPKILLLYEILDGLTERETDQMTGTLNAMLKYGSYTALFFSTGAQSGLHTDTTIWLGHGKVRES